MKKLIFLLLPLTFFSPLSSQEVEQPSVFEALEMLIQRASQKTESETEPQVADTTVGEREDEYQGVDPVLSIEGFEG